VDYEMWTMMSESCVFCSYAGRRQVVRYNSVIAFLDNYPVTEGHFLIVPERHIHDLFEMTSPEVTDLMFALHSIRQLLLASDSSIAGFNVGANIGAAAGQTVEHAHIHLIPRRHGDVAEPAGGIRAVIPSRTSYPE
jgi:ATP adenylyltransferase